MKHFLHWTALAALVACSLPAMAWGPQAQSAIVDSAAKVVARDAKIPLTNLLRDVIQGASVPDSVASRLVPHAEDDPVGAITSEMYVLQSVYRNRVDPYLAFRLGLLGKLVASATAPMENARTTYRNLYYADVERAITSATLQLQPRRTVDPAAYFERMQRMATARDDMIVKDYQDGLGFDGVARASLSENASRSVDAVADVWYTILTSQVAMTNLAESQTREYVINALDFYIRRGNPAEIDATYGRLVRLGQQTTDLRKQIGDMFYDAGQFERAMREYRSVLDEEPGRRDVRTRMADYFVRVGDEALSKDELEAAREAYDAAGEVDKLHPKAQAKRIDSESLIAARDARMVLARENVTSARELETQADRAAMQRQYTQAIALVNQAISLYQAVSQEFREEAREAATGVSRLQIRLAELKREVFDKAKTLSGSGNGGDTKRLALENASVFSERALRGIVKRRHDTEIKALTRDLRNQLESESSP